MLRRPEVARRIAVRNVPSFWPPYQAHDALTPLQQILTKPSRMPNGAFVVQPHRGKLMHRTSCILNLGAALALTTLSATVLAQTAVVSKATCQGIGVAPQEPIGDREGHAITVSQYSCHSEGGPLDGTVMTGTIIFEWNKGVPAVMLVGSGVFRKPGAIAVFQDNESALSLTMADGKVTGFTGTSKGVYKLSTGSLASLAGKSYTTTFHTIGGGQYVVERASD
jgi:hypothetical protein